MKHLKLFEKTDYLKYKNKVLIDKALQDFYFVDKIEKDRNEVLLYAFKFTIKSINWSKEFVDQCEIDEYKFVTCKPFWFYERAEVLTFDDFYEQFPNLCSRLYSKLLKRRYNDNVPFFKELEFKVQTQKYNL